MRMVVWSAAGAKRQERSSLPSILVQKAQAIFDPSDKRASMSQADQWKFVLVAIAWGYFRACLAVVSE